MVQSGREARVDLQRTTDRADKVIWGSWLVGGSALLAGLVANLLPLVAGVAAGWPPWRIAAHAALGALFLALVYLEVSPTAAGRWLCAHPALYLTVMGLIGCALMALSGDPFVQPVVFTIPFVHALFLYGRRGGAAVGVAYLALLALGLVLAGERSPIGVAYPVGVYGALMVFMAAFVDLADQQRAARERADALAAENARLAAGAALSATLSERNRIARELHDTIAQGLTAATMQLEAAQRALDRDPGRARARLARAHELARATLADVRRSVWLLGAPLVDGPALGAALDDLVARFAERTGIRASYAHTGGGLDLDSERAAQVLRIVQEALQNVERHAGAGTVEVRSARAADGCVSFCVRDDGRGFDPARPPASLDGGGFGLSSLRERAHLAGAALLIDSAPGRGTLVRVSLPPAEEAAR
jgi:signal transduction histidine kinase